MEQDQLPFLPNTFTQGVIDHGYLRHPEWVGEQIADVAEGINKAAEELHPPRGRWGGPTACPLSLEENGVSGQLGAVSHAHLTSAVVSYTGTPIAPTSAVPILGLQGPEKEEREKRH
jgi:hypothetical protein